MKGSLVFLWLICCPFILRSLQGGEQQTPFRNDQIQELSTQINQLRSANDLVGLRQLVAEAKKVWLPTKNTEYYPVVFELYSAINSIAPQRSEVYEEVNDLVISFIDSPDEKPGEAVGKLLLLLQSSVSSQRGLLKDNAWAIDRNNQTQRWLKVWKSIREQLAALPEPAGPFYFRVSPPAETGLPDGVGPSAVKDPVLRKQFEDAIEENTRRDNAFRKKRDAADFEKFFAGHVKLQLVETYSRPPFQTKELEESLENAGIDREVRAEIVDEVKKRVAARIERDAKLPKGVPAAVVKEIEPPGTAVQYPDLRLRKLVTFNIPAPLVEQILEKLREGTGVKLARAEDIQNHFPAMGSVSYTGVPAWKVMDHLAASKYVEGRWEKEGDGYRLVRNDKPVNIPEVAAAPTVPVAPTSSLRRILDIVGPILTLAAIIIVALLLIRRSKAAR